MRRLWIQVHLWLGLTLGVLGILIGITGLLPALFVVKGAMMWLRKRG